MKLHRIRLENLRGIESFELRLEDVGVTVVEGPNESGKSSVAEAIDIAFEYLDSSAHKTVKALKPVHRDAGTEIELDLSTGPYRLVYRKRWHRSPSTTLSVSTPRPEQLTGREAHERMRAILEETLDLGLWKALQVQQGDGDEQAAPTESRSLLAALDRAAADRAPQDDAEGTIWQRVVVERERYWTATGRPSAERRRLADDLAAARQDAARLGDEIARLEDAAEQHRRLGEQRAELREAVRTGRATRDALAAAWTEVERRRREVDDLVRLDELARRDVQDAERRAAERADAALELQQRADEAARLSDAVEPAAATLRAAERLRDLARARLEEARTARRRQDSALDAARAAAEHHRVVADHAVSTRRLVDVEQAESEIRVARSVLTEGPATSAEDVRALEDAHIRLAAARAALRAGAPSVRIEALQDAELLVDGEAVHLARGESSEHIASDAFALELGGQIRVVVRGGGELAVLQSAAEAAREAFEACCARLGYHVEGALDAARDREAACSAAARGLAQAEARLKVSLDGTSTPVLRDRIAELAAQLDRERAAGVIDGAEDESAAARRQSEAASTATAARDQEIECEAALDPLESEVRDRGTELHGITIRAQLARDGVASLQERLADQRESVADAALVADVDERRVEREDAARRLAVARAALAELDPEQSKLLLDNAQQVLAGLEREDGSLQAQQIHLSGQLAARGEDALQEQLDEALARSVRLEADAAALERRARAAARLHDVLDARRRQARAALVAPFREQVESLGRVVFGPDLQIELDDDLRIVSRTAGGVTVPWDGLSTGAREQFGIIARLACAAIVAPGGEGVPVVLDDAFGHSDDGRLARMGAVLALAGRSGQVLVLTCSPARFRGVGGAAVLHMADLLRSEEVIARPIAVHPDDAVLAALTGARDALSKSEILELTGIDQDSWGETIGQLVSRGAVLQVGQARGTRYRRAS